MKICLLSQALPYLPSPGGFRLYGGNLLRQWSKRHSVDLISFLEDEDKRHLDWPKPYCSSIQVIDIPKAGLFARVANAISTHMRGRQLHGREQLTSLLIQGLRSKRWDVIHVEGAAAGGLVPEGLEIPKVLSVHDSWTLRAAEMLKCSQSAKEKLYYSYLKYHEPSYERILYPQYDAVTVVAEPDLVEVRKVVPNANVVLIPYGTDTDYFHPMPVKKEPATLVFHSHLGYPPNIEAALEFANEIFPIVRREVPDAVFHLVGTKPGPKIKELASRPGIRISADLPDLREAVCSGTVYVCAIRYGTGLKSKMLEAMAMRMPIVGYPGATVGLEVVHGKHVMEAHTPQEFASYVIELIKSSTRAEALANAGRQLVEERYSWDSRARVYEELYQQLIQARAVRSNTGSAVRQNEVVESTL